MKNGWRGRPGSCLLLSAIRATTLLLRSECLGGSETNTSEFSTLTLSGLNLKEKRTTNKGSAILRWPSGSGFVFCVKNTLHFNPPALKSLKGMSHFMIPLKPCAFDGHFRPCRDSGEHRFRLRARWAPLESDCITDDSPQRLMHDHDNHPSVLLIQ